MATPANNLFLRLHKWASRQDENFLTESLALVLEHLLVLAPAAGTRLIAHLTDELNVLSADDASAIDICTQVEIETGRPDLEIRTTHCRALIEVKVEAKLGFDQLKRYRAYLDEYKDKGERTKLVLLTRYPHVFQPKEVCPDHSIRWFQVAHWFETELSAAEPINAVVIYLVQQYLDFLRARNMAIEKVTWELTSGVRAFSHLMNMLCEAASACKVSINRTTGWGYVGIHLDKAKYAVSLSIAEPEKLWFGTKCRINPELARKLGDGELEETKSGNYIWWKSVELDCEEVHFFARSKVSQMEWLEKFLQDCLTMARSITTSDELIPEEQEKE